MSYTLIKVIISSLLIVAISELSKRSSLLGALLASLPLMSVLAMLWLYIDTKDTGKVANVACKLRLQTGEACTPNLPRLKLAALNDT